MHMPDVWDPARETRNNRRPAIYTSQIGREASAGVSFVARRGRTKPLRLTSSGAPIRPMGSEEQTDRQAEMLFAAALVEWNSRDLAMTLSLSFLRPKAVIFDG